VVRISGIAAEPSILYKFHISEVFNEGDWSGLIKPEIEEDHPWRAETTEDEDPRFKMRERFDRVIIVQFANSQPDEAGFARGYESSNSTDTFNIVIKSRSFTEVRKYLERLRKIVIALPSDDFYSRIEFKGVVDSPERGFWYTTFQAVCYRTGRLVDG
jgi:hypothetical protein